MNLTMCVITRHHMVVRKASVCRESAETRHRSRNPLLPRPSARVITGALGVPESLTVSARSARSTNGRLRYHQVVSGGDINGLTHAEQPRRRAYRSLDASSNRTAFRSYSSHTKVEKYRSDRTQSRNGKCMRRGRSSANTTHTMQNFIQFT